MAANSIRFDSIGFEKKAKQKSRL